MANWVARGDGSTSADFNEARFRSGGAFRRRLKPISDLCGIEDDEIVEASTTCPAASTYEDGAGICSLLGPTGLAS